jgi:hypothetical protein
MIHMGTNMTVAEGAAAESGAASFTPGRIEAETASRLPADARANGTPVIVIIMGPICAGKTTVRRARYERGFVLIDAAQLFIDLGGFDLDFPSTLEAPMERIGSEVARRAVSQNMNIVTEIVGAKYEPVAELAEAMKAAGYKVEFEFVHADLPTCLEREQGRTMDNVSSYYAEKYQMKWLRDAARLRPY